MVERLKQAIEKARATRAAITTMGTSTPNSNTAALPASVGFDWHLVPEVEIDPARLNDARIADQNGLHPSTQLFEGLRSRLTRLCDQNNWKRIALTAPTPGCGVTTFSLNLALSLALKGQVRVLLVDLNLTRPAIADRLGLTGRSVFEASMNAIQPIETALYRLGENLIVAADDKPAKSGASVMPKVLCNQLLGRLEPALRPDIVLLDLPPVLARDDTEELLANCDAALLIASSDRTTAPEVEEAAQVIAQSTSYLGTALNRALDRGLQKKVLVS